MQSGRGNHGPQQIAPINRASGSAQMGGQASSQQIVVHVINTNPAVLPSEVRHFGPGGLQLNNVQKRILMLHEFKLGTASEVAAEKINQLFGAGAITDSYIQEAYRQFTNGNESWVCPWLNRK